jgi:uncharacterized protein (DUF1015 family)
MATVRPFRALRPPPEKASGVSAVPYDVVSTEEARRLAAGNPLSFLHVSRSEIDLPEGTDPYAGAVYAKAAENFATLKREAPLSLEGEPSLYVYRLRMDGHEQTGIAGCCSLDEYDRDVVRKHERTRPDKEDDRTRHMLALKAQTGPVFLTYRGRAEIDAIVEDTARRPPLFDFTAPDGVAHTIWRVPGEAAGRLSEQFRPVPLLYIADGHHRAASAARARRELAGKNPRHTGEEVYNFFLAVAFPAGEVRILPYNRVAKELNGRTPQEFLFALEEKFSVRPDASPSPRRKGEISVYLAGRWYGLLIPPGGVATGGAISSLDAALLQEKILEPLLGIKDIRTDKRIDFIGGIRGTKELEGLVDTGKAAVAFSLYPVLLDDLMAVSDANEIMPPKSTWFEPKLRDGLLIHEI